VGGTDVTRVEVRNECSILFGKSETEVWVEL
jgi:hypothetical protein